MNKADEQYLTLLKHVLENGEVKKDRTGVGTKSIFGYQMRFNLNEGFPLLTTKKIYWNGVVQELLWFLRGETNVRSLQAKNVHIWDAWADKDGSLGPIYGRQWRRWHTYDGEQNIYIDQIADIIEQIKTNPSSRRLIVNSWNVGDLSKMCLPPCHLTYQFYVSNGKLSCQLYQRSADIFLGLPFNIASYSLLTHMIAQICDLGVGDFIHTSGDAHIYSSHTEQVEIQLSRDARELPQVSLDTNIKNIDDFKSEHIQLLNYNPHPAIKAPIAV